MKLFWILRWYPELFGVWFWTKRFAKFNLAGRTIVWYVQSCIPCIQNSASRLWLKHALQTCWAKTDRWPRYPCAMGFRNGPLIWDVRGKSIISSDYCMMSGHITWYNIQRYLVNINNNEYICLYIVKVSDIRLCYITALERLSTAVCFFMGIRVKFKQTSIPKFKLKLI